MDTPVLREVTRRAGEYGEFIGIRTPDFKGPCRNPQVSELGRPCFDLGVHCALRDLTDLPREALVEAARGKRFVVVGEDHPRDYPLRILEPLMDSGMFKGLFTEALIQGDYGRAGLVEVMAAGLVYYWNMDKYNRMIVMALSRGLEVRGIDVPLPNAEERRSDLPGYHARRVGSWTRYMIENAAPGCQYLVLVGDAHLDFRPDPENQFNLPVRLVGEGIRPEEVLTISSSPYPPRS